MPKLPKLPKLPKINWKSFIIIMIVLVLAVTAIKVIPKCLSGRDKNVSYEIIEPNRIPDQIQEILPRYKMLERALAAKIEEDIYVIVTRGEKLSGGYEIEIENIQILKEDKENKVVVNATFKDPNDDELVTQSITYPCVVVKTSLKELPQKIELKINYD